MSDEALSSYRSALEICNERRERLLREPACREVPDGARAQAAGRDDAFRSEVLGLEIRHGGSCRRLGEPVPLEVVEHEQVPGAAGGERPGTELREARVVHEACPEGRFDRVVALLRPDAAALESRRKGCARVLTPRHGFHCDLARSVAPKRSTEGSRPLPVELAADRELRFGRGGDGHRSPRATVELDGDEAALRSERRDGGHVRAGSALRRDLDRLLDLGQLGRLGRLGVRGGCPR